MQSKSYLPTGILKKKIGFFSGHSCLWKVRANRLFCLPSNYPNKWTVPLTKKPWDTFHNLLFSDHNNCKDLRIITFEFEASVPIMLFIFLLFSLVQCFQSVAIRKLVFTITEPPSIGLWRKINKISEFILSLGLKGLYGVILLGPLCKHDNARFTMVPFVWSSRN